MSLADADPYLLAIGTRVRAMRVLRMVTQDRLSELTGVSRVTLGSIERADHSATLLTYRKIAGALGLDVGDLVSDRELRIP